MSDSEQAACFLVFTGEISSVRCISPVQNSPVWHLKCSVNALIDLMLSASDSDFFPPQLTNRTHLSHSCAIPFADNVANVDVDFAILPCGAVAPVTLLRVLVALDGFAQQRSSMLSDALRSRTYARLRIASDKI